MMRLSKYICCSLFVLLMANSAFCAETLPLDRWNRYLIDENLPWFAVYIVPADLNGDRQVDLIAGANWYESSGALNAAWTRHAIGQDFNNVVAAYDFDADGDQDLLGTDGQPNSGRFLWARNDGRGQFAILDNLEEATGDFVQGVAIDKFQDGKLQVALSWHKNGGGVKAYTVPADPSKDMWKLSLLSAESEEEDLTAGDIDRDGDLDLLLGITWLSNDGNAWIARKIGEIKDLAPKGEPDRNALADVDGDGDLDAIVALENGTPLVWFEQVNATDDEWIRHQVSDVPGQGFSMEVIDADADGDVDIIVGEHRNPSKTNRLLLFENADQGKQWIEHTLDSGEGIGIDHHDGSMPVDLDGDGDLDVISLSWTNKKVWVFENRATQKPQTPATSAVAEGPLAGPQPEGLAPSPTTKTARKQSAAGKGPGKRNAEKAGIGKGGAAKLKAETMPAATMPAAPVSSLPSLPYDHQVIDAAPLGTEMDITLIGDINGDGKPDVVIGGKSGEANLVWYENPSWKRRVMAVKTQLEAGGVLFDVNGDKRLDVIAGAPGNGPNLYWFENPAEIDAPWTKRIIENTFKKYHDQTVGDLDNDGKPEVLFSSQKAGVIAYYDIPDDPTQEPWPADHRHIIRSDTPNMEGLVIVDLDGDGKNETLIGPDIFTLQANGEWTAKNLTPEVKETRVAVGDFNQDGKKDIVLCEGERSPGKLVLCLAPDYTPQTLRWDLARPHSLQIADLNADGHDDIFIGEMGAADKASQPARLVALISRGDGSFEEMLIASGTSTHEAKVADMNGDNRLDVIGKPYTKDASQVDLWIHKTEGAATTQP